MDALVVVHSESLGITIERERKLLDRIDAEMVNYIQRRDGVYYLGWNSCPPNPESMHPEIRKYFPSVTYIHGGPYLNEQFLKTKELLINNSIQEITIAGVTYSVCVNALYRFLLGMNNDIDPIDGYLREVRFGYLKDNGYPEEVLQKILSAKLDVHIRDELTDKTWK